MARKLRVQYPNATYPVLKRRERREPIARGGMGVLYKARQKSLNRIVAVKMILAGQSAGEKDMQRFHTEAEAAANLQHPNIVAIHDVVTHEGRHYFSMDYVAGKNLAELVKDGRVRHGHRMKRAVRKARLSGQVEEEGADLDLEALQKC